MEELAIQDYALQYGVLGIVAFILAYVAFAQYKRLLKKNDALEAKVDKLQQEMITIMVEERERLSNLVSENTQALSELQKTILTYLVNNR
jgi:cell division protein FtsB